jgi:hypothetical protein
MFNVLFIDMLAFVSKIFKRIKYRTIEWIPKKT